MKSREQLGAKAVRLGFTSRQQVDEALDVQRAKKERGEHIPLGALLIEMGKLAPAQLVPLLDDSALSGFHLAEDAVRLAAHFHRTLGEDDRLIMFTSPADSSDVYTIMSQLALAMALMGQGPILLIDANLRAPELHSRFHLRQAPGLAELIDGDASEDQCIVPTGLEGLSILPAGKADGDLLARLLSVRCAELLDGFRSKFRLTLVATSAVLDFPEATLLGARTDGVVVAVRAHKQRRSQLSETTRVLQGLNVKMYGSILLNNGLAKRVAP
jgi:Mrp family chromosome partitioning ATPase